MDRSGAAGLLAAGVAGLAGLALAAGQTPPLRALRWLAPGADPARAMGLEPTECLDPSKDPDQAYRIEVGRAAFRAPLLLGGQASRAGLSCDSCHRNGRSNPDFRFPGVSGAPGTADVTSSLFSSRRGDGVFNPKPIPDLSGAELKVPREGRALESFVHGLAVEEFDGAEPPAAVIDGLGAYLRALSPAACSAQLRRAVSVGHYADDALRAVAAAQGALERRDPSTAAVMIGAARARLGLIDERFDTPALAAVRNRLRATDAELAAALELVRSEDPAAVHTLLAWRARSADWRGAAKRAERRSLFAQARLARLRPSAPARR